MKNTACDVTDKLESILEMSSLLKTYLGRKIDTCNVLTLETPSTLHYEGIDMKLLFEL